MFDIKISYEKNHQYVSMFIVTNNEIVSSEENSK